jgi:hypothetical protein
LYDITVKLLKVILIAVLLIASGCKSAETGPKGSFGGTFIGAVVASDGIVVASDSRSTFIDPDGRRIGYVDQMQKIYVDGGAAVAVSGLTSVEDELFSAFMERHDFLMARPVNEILFDLALRLPVRNANGVLLISAGFEHGQPTICAKGPLTPQSCRNSGYVVNKDSPALRRWKESLGGRPYKAAEAAAVLEKAIREAADLDAAIGGPIAELLVPSAGSPRWLSKPPNDNSWTRVCDVVDSHRKARTTIFFTNSKDELESYLSRVCPR